MLLITARRAGPVRPSFRVRAGWRARARLLARSAPVAAALLALGACGSAPGAGPASPPSTVSPGQGGGGSPVPVTSPASPAAVSSPQLTGPAHTVVVIMENRGYSQVIGNSAAAYINALAHRGALFTNSYAVAHPSEPNYLALFSGSTQGVGDDSCPLRFTTPNLGSELIAAHLTFAGYSENLPAVGSDVCDAGLYARRHVPWADFSNVPASDSRPFSSFPAGNYARLPTVSFVIPNLCHDMHDCPVSSGDAWLRAHIGGYATWAMTHNSLLVVTWDEDDGSANNHIPTIFAGQQVRPGRYGMTVTHYGVLHTIEQLYHLRPEAHASTANVITGIWK